MALDDFLDSEVAVAVAATAALTSPQVRGMVRRAAVYGVSGLLSAGTVIASVAESVLREVQHGSGVAGGGLEDITARPSEASVAAGQATGSQPSRSRVRRGQSYEESGDQGGPS